MKKNLFSVLLVIVLLYIMNVFVFAVDDVDVNTYNIDTDVAIMSLYNVSSESIYATTFSDGMINTLVFHLGPTCNYSNYNSSLECIGQTDVTYYFNDTNVDSFSLYDYSYNDLKPQILKVVFLDEICPLNVKNLFTNFINLREIENLSNLNTINVTNMHGMFAGTYFTTLDLSTLNTSNVTDMSYMFSGCSNLINLNISSFDTSNVTDMSYMFQYCRNLQYLDISSFDTSYVTNAMNMFNECIALKELDLSSFDTSNLNNSTNIFGSGLRLDKITVGEKFSLKLSNLFYTAYLKDGTQILGSNIPINTSNTYYREDPTKIYGFLYDTGYLVFKRKDTQADYGNVLSTREIT